MLEIGIIRNQKERVVEGYHKRNLPRNSHQELDVIISLDDERKSVQTSLDATLAESNALSKEIGDLFKAGKANEVAEKKKKVAALKEMTKELETKHKEIKDRIEEKLLSLPNVPHSSVPKGKTPEENEVFKAWDKSFPSLHADALPHWELAEKYDLF